MIKNEANEINGIRLVFGYLGLFMFFIGVLELTPLINVIFYNNELSEGLYFLYPAAGAMAIGFGLYCLIIGKKKGSLTANQGVSLVLMIWLTAILLFSLPWVISGKMNFTRAFFECTSGFTTTGLTTCDVENTSHVFLFSRSLMTFTGGIGLVLILTTALSDKSRASVYTLEGHTDKLLPNLKNSARLLLTIYLGFSLLGVFALKLTGLSWFDSICTTMSAISTGGFATTANSLVAFNNLGAEIVTIVLMIIGATNFMFYYFLLSGKFSKAFKNYEIFVAITLFLIFGSTFVISFSISTGSIGLGFRYGIFHYFTTMTGAGFTNFETPMLSLAPHVFILTVVLMVCGGQSGSTAGGIKHYRIAYLFIAFKTFIKDKVINKDLLTTQYVYKYGDKVIVKPEDKKEAVNYSFLYVLIGVLGAFLISLFGYTPSQSIFEFISCLGTTGLSSGVTSSSTPSFVLWVEIFGMFFGRLELTILFVHIQRNLLLAKHKILSRRRAKLFE